MRHVNCECEFPHATPEGCARQKHLAENILHSLEQSVRLRSVAEIAEEKADAIAPLREGTIPIQVGDATLDVRTITCAHCAATSGSHHAPECPLWSQGRVPTPPMRTNGVKNPTMHVVKYVEERTFGVAPAQTIQPGSNRRRPKKREKPTTTLDREAYATGIRYHFDALFAMIDQAKAELSITTRIYYDYDKERMAIDIQQEL